MSAAAERDVPSGRPDVSVVVPVYNPGVFIEPCIASLLAQTLRPDRCQLVFVDDGSTDETPQRLDELAREHPNVIVRHEPNSGWPGRPRNVGIEVSDGEFLFFCDHDDLIEPDGLETLVATARRTDADVVVGKMVGRQRRIPIELFRESRDHATVFDSDLMWALTPHKLFRRSMLDEHGLRFPEGKRRLEDHTFVTGAYFAARNVAVVADRPIYHHIRREDAGNAAYTAVDFAGYYRNARESMDIVQAGTEPGEIRDRAMWRFLRGQMLDRLSEPQVLRMTDDDLHKVFHEVRTLLFERYPEAALDRLRPLHRARARAIRDDRLDLIMAVANRASEVVARGEVNTAADDGGSWRLQCEATLAHADGTPLQIEALGDGWHVPALVPPELEDRPSTTEDVMTSARARITLRERTSWEEWIVPATVVADLVADDVAAGSARSLSLTVDVEIDPNTVAGGRPLPAGQWDLRLAVTWIGLARRTRLGSAPTVRSALPAPRLDGNPMVMARVHVAASGNLSVEVAPPGRKLGAFLAANPVSSTVPDRTRMDIALQVSMSEAAGRLPCWLELRAPGSDQAVKRKAVIRRTSAGGAQLSADLTTAGEPAPGSYELWLGFKKDGRTWLIGDVTIARDGLRGTLRRWSAS